MRDIDEIRADILETVKTDAYTKRAKYLWYEFYTALFSTIDMSRLQEIAAAEREGRCVVLPCKVGDTVYEALFEWDCTECLKTSFKPKVRERKVTHFMFGKRGDIILGVAGDGADYLIYGKTVFLTRAEAEEALKEAQHE